MGLGKHFANEFRCFAGIDQVINNQHSVPVLFVRHPFQNFQFSLILVLVGRHAHCIDQPDFQFTGDDRCRDETAPGDGDDRPPGAGFSKSPG